jgi:hypothetical protein
LLIPLHFALDTYHSSGAL